MPCYDSRDDDPQFVCERYIKRLNKVTRLLCGLCTELERLGSHRAITQNKELLAWWEEHQEFDNRRKNKKNNGK